MQADVVLIPPAEYPEHTQELAASQLGTHVLAHTRRGGHLVEVAGAAFCRLADSNRGGAEAGSQGSV